MSSDELRALLLLIVVLSVVVALMASRFRHYCPECAHCREVIAEKAAKQARLQRQYQAEHRMVADEHRCPVCHNDHHLDDAGE